jgi:putative tryptophan/tyrosine transport system substrate-binding protein
MTCCTLGLLITLALGLLLEPFAAEAQPAKKLPHIGYLALRSEPADQDAAFQQGLRELGWVEGQNMAIEYRWAADRVDRLPALAEELVRLEVDVIVASATPVVKAAKHATSTIPIVMPAVADAVDAGLVQNLARPGENVTGLSFLDTELSAKRLELLKEALPTISRVVILRRVTSTTAALRAVESAGRSLGLQLQLHEVRGPEDFDQAFHAMRQERADALNVLASPILNAHRKTLIELAARYQLPAVYQWKEFAEEGGLMAYGASLPDMYRRAATYVDKILKGTKPADLPVEQPIKFELVINLKTAQALGLTIPPMLVFQADEVIR